MRIQNNHLHAISIYTPTRFCHFVALFISLRYAKQNKSSSVTQHLPFAIEHSDQFHFFEYSIGYLFIIYGEVLKRVFNIPLYWENSPVLREGTWDLRYGQTNWSNVPQFIDLCIDTGHLMLGAKTKQEAQERIVELFKKRSSQIKHLHVHENDFKSDLHLKPFKRRKSLRVIDEGLLKKITKNRSFIFEDPS